MTIRLVSYVAISGLVFLLAPALAGGVYLAHPGPWAGFVVGLLTLASQPPLTPKALVTDGRDKRSALLIFVAVLAANLVSVLQFSWRDAVTPPARSFWVIIGVGIAVAGMGLRLWAIRTLGRFFTSSVMVQEGQRVLDHGPYHAVRHPSYTGSVLTVLGTSLALGSSAGIVLIVVAVLPAYLYRIAVEERTLIAGLGEPYLRYRARTPALIPLPSRDQH